VTVLEQAESLCKNWAAWGEEKAIAQSALPWVLTDTLRERAIAF
jgi:hypothetical protein